MTLRKIDIVNLEDNSPGVINLEYTYPMSKMHQPIIYIFLGGTNHKGNYSGGINHEESCSKDVNHEDPCARDIYHEDLCSRDINHEDNRPTDINQEDKSPARKQISWRS